MTQDTMSDYHTHHKRFFPNIYDIMAIMGLIERIDKDSNKTVLTAVPKSEDRRVTNG
jgi:hypothetical protein